MDKYETVMILTPTLSADQAKEAVSKFRKILKDLGANIIHEEDWGLNKNVNLLQEEKWDPLEKATGYYHLFEYTVNGSAVAELEIALKRDARVLRFLTVKLDKHATTDSTQTG